MSERLFVAKKIQKLGDFFMNFQFLKYFLAVAEEENISRACEVLHITQPTISRQIADFEKERGILLFKRGSRKLTLTEDGELLKRRAEEILSLVEKTEGELVENAENLSGTICIGGGELQAVSDIAKKIAEFQKIYPKVSFDFVTATSDVIIEQMDKGLLDIGILLEPVDIEKFNFMRFPQKEHYVLLVNKNSPLSKKDFVTAEDLKNEPLILPSRNAVRNELAAWFGTYFKNLNIIGTSNLSGNKLVMVKHGNGSALVIENEVACSREKDDVFSKPLSPSLEAFSVLVWKRNIPYSVAAKKFIEFVSQDNL